MKNINICSFIDSRLFRYLFILSVFIWIGSTYFIQLERIIHLGMILLGGSVAFLGYACKLDVRNNYIIAIVFFIPILLGIFIVVNEIIKM